MAEAGVDGGTVIVVAPGTVEARISEERMDDMEAASELDDEEVLVVVELVACLFFARWTNLLAMMGFSE